MHECYLLKVSFLTALQSAHFVLNEWTFQHIPLCPLRVSSFSKKESLLMLKFTWCASAGFSWRFYVWCVKIYSLDFLLPFFTIHFVYVSEWEGNILWLLNKEVSFKDSLVHRTHLNHHALSLTYSRVREAAFAHPQKWVLVSTEGSADGLTGRLGQCTPFQASVSSALKWRCFRSRRQHTNIVGFMVVGI